MKERLRKGRCEQESVFWKLPDGDGNPSNLQKGKEVGLLG